MSSLSNHSEVNNSVVTSIPNEPSGKNSDGSSNNSSNNNNTDENENATYQGSKMEVNSYMVLGTRFDIDARYSILDSVGQGAYGIVCAARDDKEDSVVAIKKMEKIFEHATFTKRTLRELIILRKMQHENVIALKTILRPINPHTFEEIYVVFELMETDLSSIIKSPQPLYDEHVQFFLYQILRGLKYIHSCNIIHRDLKPRNLLVNSNCDLKICDFGLARVDLKESRKKTTVMTDYIATRWYRPPEIILSWKTYTKAIDLWSVGCIFGELLGRKPMFPGSDSQSQIQLIMNFLGTPSEADMSQIKQPKAKSYLSNLPKRDPVDAKTLFPDVKNDDAIDLLRKLLVFNPAKRFTADEALKHPYLVSLHCPEDEPVGKPILQSLMEWEEHFLTLEEYRKLMVNEIKFANLNSFNEDNSIKMYDVSNSLDNDVVNSSYDKK
jgi:mitogen-activated protein kinase 1/3